MRRDHPCGCTRVRDDTDALVGGRVCRYHQEGIRWRLLCWLQDAGLDIGVPVATLDLWGELEPLEVM